MKFLATALLALPALSSAYVVTYFGASNCAGGSTALNLASNGKCTGIPASGSVSYESDIGCVLSTYDDEGCTGQKAVTRSQNTCFAPGYTIRGVICA